MRPRPRRVQLVLDFDGTITTTDTTAVIGSRCLAKARAMATPGIPEEDFPKPMQYYSEEYLRELKQWQDSFNWPHSRETIDEEVSYLSQSKQIEQNSFVRARNAVLDTPGNIKAFLHHGQDLKDFMMQAGSQAVRDGDVQIRDRGALQHLIARVHRLGVVSVSWSRMFVLGVLLEVGLLEKHQEEAFADQIRCNELLGSILYDETKRPITISSAADKRDALRQLLSEWTGPVNEDGRPLSSNAGEGCETITMYVGDSMTDLGCLAYADIGIYITQSIGGEDKLISTLEDVGYQCVPLSTSMPASPSQSPTDEITSPESIDPGQRVVYLVRGFREIDDWLSKIGCPA